MQDEALLAEQLRYYRPSHRAEWFRELALVEAALRNATPTGDVLELACGTGLSTHHLAELHRRVVRRLAVQRWRTDLDNGCLAAAAGHLLKRRTQVSARSFSVRST
jgi:ubiquinone/menaquinone biosynthesis C-methylase UbiE